MVFYFGEWRVFVSYLWRHFLFFPFGEIYRMRNACEDRMNDAWTWEIVSRANFAVSFCEHRTTNCHQHQKLLCCICIRYEWALHCNFAEAIQLQIHKESKEKKIGWSVIVRRCEDHIRHVCLMNESIVRKPPRTYGNCVFNYSISLSHCERNKFPHDHYSIREWKMVVANSFIRSIWVMGRVEVRKCLQQLETYVHQTGECINILLFHLYWPENDSVIVVLSHVVNHKLCGCVWGSNHVTS